MQNHDNTNNIDTWTIVKLLSWSTSYFESHKIDSPRSTSEILLSHALGLKRIDLYLRFDQPLAANELSLFKQFLKRRIENEPVAYITGKKGFWSHEFHVSKDTLIPRPDTECIVEEVIEYIGRIKNEKQKILELGTGTGAIILSIAADCKGDFYASDLSKGALDIAKKNANELGINVNFFEGSWFEPFEGESFLNSFDVIISNPPYIPTDDINGLAPEINKFEPLSALDGGDDGLDDLKHIIDKVPLYLKKKGQLYLEMGFDQGDALKEYATQKKCFSDISVIKDFGGNPRVTSMTLS
ncbi:MAG: peptide chain release factor N(5)-glutamine methyltransferase [Deltaproteobacteria bacterium]|nr:peptide chain release factor N(5)-glutamine methyltransferase [Deltaproteobacteria bacterium]